MHTPPVDEVVERYTGSCKDLTVRTDVDHVRLQLNGDELEAVVSITVWFGTKHAFTHEKTVMSVQLDQSVLPKIRELLAAQPVPRATITFPGEYVAFTVDSLKQFVEGVNNMLAASGELPVLVMGEPTVTPINSDTLRDTAVPVGSVPRLMPEAETE